MARDIIVLGMDQSRLLKGLENIWEEEALAPELLKRWKEKLANPAVQQLLELENFLWQESNWENEKTQEKLGWTELISFRSRANSLALVLLIHYYNDHFSWEGADTPRFEMSDGCALLDTLQMQSLLEWLYAAGATYTGEQKDLAAADPVYLEQARKMKEEPGYYAADFNDFQNASLWFPDWRRTIREREFELYYLIDA